MHTRACTRAYLDSLWPTSAQVRLHSPLTHPTASLTPRPQVAMPLGPASHFDPFPRASTAVPMMMGGGGSGSSVGGGMGGAWSACELHPPQTSPVVTMPYTALGHQMRRSASSSAMTLSITAPSLSTPMVRPPSAVGEVRDVDRTHQPWAACDPRAHQPWVPCDPRAHQPWAPCDHHLAGRSVQPWGGTGYALLLSAAADDSGDLFASEVSAFSCARTHTYTRTRTRTRARTTHTHRTPHTKHPPPPPPPSTPLHHHHNACMPCWMRLDST